MSSFIVLLLAGTVVSTTIKVGLLAAWVKTYRASRQNVPDPTLPVTRRQRFVNWITRRSPPRTAA